MKLRERHPRRGLFEQGAETFRAFHLSFSMFPVVSRAGHAVASRNVSSGFQRSVFEEQNPMLYPSKADCIAILSAASRVSDADMLLALDHKNLGLSRNAMDAAAAFLTERGCFNRYTFGVTGVSVGALSLQGRLRLDQLANG
jgi:hypothetical protein